MDKLIERVYGLAPGVEDGPPAQRAEYLAVKARQAQLRRQLAAALGGANASLLQSYDDAARAEGELSARHFFQEGFRAGQDLCRHSL